MTPDRKIVRYESRPLVVWENGTSIVGWCVFVERIEYDDGTVETVYGQLEPPKYGAK